MIGDLNQKKHKLERIFISYKRENAKQVYGLVNKIEHTLKEKCWIDIDGIESADQFLSKICNAIEKADVVLFMYSSVHLTIDYESDFTIRELNYALAKKKRVILVRLDDSPLDNVILMLFGTSNNIDAWDKRQWNILIRDLRKYLDLNTDDVGGNLDVSMAPFNDSVMDKADRIRRIHELLKNPLNDDIINVINNNYVDNAAIEEPDRQEINDLINPNREKEYDFGHLWHSQVD